MKRLTAVLTVIMMLALSCCASFAEQPAMPEELIGAWAGTGATEDGAAVDITVSFAADGTGHYTLDQGDYHEENDFAITVDGSAFKIAVEGVETLSGVDGTWEIAEDVLSIAFTSNFANGTTYSYTAEFTRAAEQPAMPEELVGAWAGTGATEDGAAVDITVSFAADGTGHYTLDQGDYHEENDFAITVEGNAFTIAVEGVETLSGVDGTWEIAEDVLSIAFTSNFANGTTYSYTAEFTRVTE